MKIYVRNDDVNKAYRMLHKKLHEDGFFKQIREVLDDGIEYVTIMLWDEERKTWGLLQELNKERGIMPNPNFDTHSLAPYYVRLRNYEG